MFPCGAKYRHPKNGAHTSDNFYQKRRRNIISNVKNQNVGKEVDLNNHPNLSLFLVLYLWKKLNWFCIIFGFPVVYLGLHIPFFRFVHFLFSLAGRKLISQPVFTADLPQCTSFQLPGAHNTLYPTTKQEQNVTGLCFYSQFAIITFLCII